jgi:hypothetical protein
MEAINKIPVSLYKTLSDKLVSTILENGKGYKISSDTAKKIIYLWRADQLASPAGIQTLVTTAMKVNQQAVEKILENLGLQELAIEARA